MEKMFTKAQLMKESMYLSTRHDICQELLHEHPPTSSANDMTENMPSSVTKSPSVTLDLLGSDTDSFVFSCRISVDKFNTLKRNEILFWRLMYTFIVKYELIDIHQLSKNHPLYLYNSEPERVVELARVENKCRKVLGKLKSECSDPSQFYASACMLKPKLYCLLSVSDVEKKRCKGISRQVVAESLKFSMYEVTFLNEDSRFDSQRSFRSRKHEIFVETVRKCSLSIQCIKRYWWDKQTSYPFFYPITLPCHFCKQKFTTTDRLAEHEIACLKSPFNIQDLDERKRAVDHYFVLQKSMLSSNSNKLS